MSSITDPDIQRKLGLQSFFQGSGYKIFREELDQLVLGALDGINSIVKSGFVDEKKLAELNFKLGRKEALQKVLFVLEDMESELQERISSNPTVKDKE
jgi:hypothetical protein